MRSASAGSYPWCSRARATLHCWTAIKPSGELTRLDTYLGKGFAIVGRSEDDLNMGAAAQRIFERLAAKTVALDQLEVVDGEVAPLLETHPAVVVRPDRLIFGVVDSSYDLDRPLGELNRKLSLKAD